MSRSIAWVFAVVVVAGASACAHQPLFRSDAELSQRTRKAPGTTVAATTTREAVVRSGPADLAPELKRVPAGTALWTAERATAGYRRVRSAEGIAGYVSESSLAIGSGSPAPLPVDATTPAAAAPAPAAAPAAAPPAAEAAPASPPSAAVAPAAPPTSAN